MREISDDEFASAGFGNSRKAQQVRARMQESKERWFVNVSVYGTPAGAYEFATEQEARDDMIERRRKFNVLGCCYWISKAGDS